MVPALFIGLGGLLLLGFGEPVRPVFSWLWPPALLAMAIWMAVRAHRQLRSWSRRWLLYPVIAMLHRWGWSVNRCDRMANFR